MINISFIVPYPQLKEIVNEVFSSHPLKDLLYQNTTVIAAENLDAVKLDCEVVIGRGYSADKLKDLKPHIPVIEVIVNAYDIIRAVEECRRTYNPKKIGLIGSHSTINGANSLCGALDYPIAVYSAATTDDINSAVDRALIEGCDALIGGFSVNWAAEARGINSILIKSGKEAVEQALNEAIRTVNVMRQEREKAEILKTITQCSADGIVYVSSDYRISEINESAKKMLTVDDSTLYKTKIQDVFPFMTSNIKDVIKSGREKHNELHKTGRITISADYIPVRVEKDIAGVVVNFQNVTKIQQDETQIRKKLSAKGLNAKYNFNDIIYSSSLMQMTIDTARKFAGVSSNILIVGETGTGKELIAQSIHNASNRNEGPFVAVNCAALSENLLESELFGYVDGAFTGAAKAGKTGLFELAHNGTLFLDEISEIPVTFQSKLLRVLQEKEVRRIGDNRVISIDVRIIAATNKNLKKLVSDGSFRQDLLYRLDVLKLYIPPLRKRESDIIELMMHFIAKYNKKFDNSIQGLSEDATELLINHEFKGNIRELRNIAERLCVLNVSDTVSRDDMYSALFPEDLDDESNQYFNNQAGSEKELIEQTLQECGRNKTRAARALGIDRTTLWRKIGKYGIKL